MNPKAKALEAKKGMTKIHVKDEGYGNVTHLAKTTKRGVARFGKGQGHSGISHWSKEN